jgi:hypothetical protein
MDEEQLMCAYSGLPSLAWYLHLQEISNQEKNAELESDKETKHTKEENKEK